MTDLIRRFRGMGVALVVLALSAGVVFAAAPRVAPVADNETAVELPSGEAPTSETPASGDPSDDASDDADDPSDDASDDADDPSDDASDDAGPAEDGASADNHGALVSEAAHMSTPPDFANHGAFVSCVAKMGKEVAAASFDWTTVTPVTCGLAPAEDPTTVDDGDAEEPSASAESGNAKAQADKVKGKSDKAKGKSDKAKGKSDKAQGRPNHRG